MNLRIIISSFTLFLILGCQESVKHELTRPEIAENLDTLNKYDPINFNDSVKKYSVKSGIVRYDVMLKTHSVDMRYHTILYFDYFGLQECKDTYSGDTLIESSMSDGIKTYKIDHRKKIAYYLTKAHFGIEPKFGWSTITAEDKKEGKVKKIANKMIAGKSCDAYEVNSGIAKVTFAGWKDIIMLADINSPGGRSYTLAAYINTDGTQEDKFSIPPGYKIK